MRPDSVVPVDGKIATLPHNAGGLRRSGSGVDPRCPGRLESSPSTARTRRDSAEPVDGKFLEHPQSAGAHRACGSALCQSSPGHGPSCASRGA